MNPSEAKLWYFSRLDITKGISQQSLRDLDSISTGLMYNKGKLIFGPEDRNEYVYVIKEGVVRLFSISEKSEEITYALLGRGDIFGALYGEEIYGVFAEAVEDSYLCAIRKVDFAEWLRKNPTAILNVNRFLGLMVYHFEIRLEEMVSKPLLKRVAGTLLRLQDKFGDREGYIKVNLPHRLLASMVGASREATTKALKELKEMGAVELRRGKVRILDRKKLEEISL